MAKDKTAEDIAENIITEYKDMMTIELQGWLVDNIEEALTEFRHEGMEAACRAVCQGCADGMPITQDGFLGKGHRYSLTKFVLCKASPIRARMAEEEG